MKTANFQGLVEFSPAFAARPNISHVLFDFDGTLSLIRQGWPEVMAPMFVEFLPPLDGESPHDRMRLALDDIMQLNGHQTIYQMIRLAERIRERGGEPRESLWYKHEYLRRLDERVGFRNAALAAGETSSEEHLVYGARQALEQLTERGMTLYLASGTDEPFVRKEAELLDIARYFNGRIYGALDNHQDFSKQMVITRILRDHDIDGSRLLSFGDGYVEIENTKEVGGMAVAIASDEAHNGSGQMDAWKRERLTRVGADVVIPDFRDIRPLLSVILGSE